MAGNPGKQWSALVVDDERPILEVLEELLDDAGFQITCFTRGKPALEALERDRFDLVLIDVGLPDMNGLTICDRARELYGNDIVILIVTADARQDRLLTAMEVGADDVVPKPFHIAELLARIDVKLRSGSGSDD